MVKISDVPKAVGSAVSKANAQYLAWSGGLCIHDHGVEPLLSSCIAGKLMEAGKQGGTTCYVTLETAFKELFEYTQAKPRGRLPSVLQGRCDVVYYDPFGRPAGLIEVKRWFSYSGQVGDLKRITVMMGKAESVKWGAVVGMRRVWSTTRVSSDVVLQRFVDKASAQFVEFRFRPFSNSQMSNPPVKYDGYTLLGYDALGVLVQRR